MQHTIGAGHDSGNREGCLGGTRVDLLQQLEDWLENEQGQRVFWLNGLAGTGKSTIAQTFAETTFAEGKLGASFFCSRDFEDRSDIQVIFPTLAYQLACQYPPFQEKLLQALKTKHGFKHGSLCTQLETLIVGPFQALQTPTLIIIDALDECRDGEPASALLSVLSRYVDRIPLVKFFITGRPEPRIRSGFRLELLCPHTEVLRLHDIKADLVDSDIKLFLKTKLTHITKNRSGCNFTEDWPSPQDVDALCEKAAGLFIYASTIVKFVASQYHPPNERLALIISLPQDTSHEGKSGINLLYTQVLGQAFHDVDEDFYLTLRSVVGAVVLASHPLSIQTLSDLLGNCGTPAGIYNALRPLHSVLLVSANIEDPVQIFHKSFADFLTNPKRCTDIHFFINPQIHHREILLSCLNLMEERLKKNICDLDDYAFLGDVEDLPTLQRAHIGDALEYACCFWATHLRETTGSSIGIKEVQQAIDRFFTTCFLFWVEALSLLENLEIGVYALSEIERWYTLVSYFWNIHKNTLFRFTQAGISSKWTHDSQRFLLESFDLISNSPSHIYHSALPLTPSSSWLYKGYAAQLSQEVKVVIGLPTEWGHCSRTVTLDVDPTALACQKDTIAVGHSSGDIIILDEITGSQVAVLSGHTDWIRSLIFSVDGTLLVSGSSDRTVKLWDMQTGGVIKTYDHTNVVYSVSISPDSVTLASGCLDGSIYLWGVWTGVCFCVINGHSNAVSSVNFSPTNSQHLISASTDHTVQQWDINGSRIGPTYEGNYVAFSLDGTHFVSWRDLVAKIHDSKSGAVITELQVPNDNDMIYCCRFSPSGELIAASTGQNIYVWDITSEPHLFKPFVGHSGEIYALAFSSSLISVSEEDKSAKFWQINTSSADPVTITTMPTPPTSALIRSVSLQARSGIAISSDSAGVVKTWDILTGICKASFQTPAEGDTRDAQLIEGRLILVWFVEEEGEIHIWDTEKDELLQTVYTSQVDSLRISGDGSKIFGWTGRSIRSWSMQTGEAVGEVEFMGVGWDLDPLCADGSRVWIYSWDSNHGWDFGILGSSPTQLPNTFPDRPHLNFIHGTRWWGCDPSRVEDTVTGKDIFQLGGRYARPYDARWDGQYLVAGYDSGEVLILDFNHVVLSRDT